MLRDTLVVSKFCPSELKANQKSLYKMVYLQQQHVVGMQLYTTIYSDGSFTYIPMNSKIRISSTDFAKWKLFVCLMLCRELHIDRYAPTGML